MKIAVIIPAAGRSKRYGSKDKLAEDLGGRPLLLRTVEFFTKREEVAEIIVAGPPEHFEDFKERFGPALSFHGVVIAKGGATRTETVSNALKKIINPVDRVAIHDAARPALSNDLFDKLILASENYHAVAAGLQIKGTVKRVEKGCSSVNDEDAIADLILGSETQMTVDAYRVTQTVDRNSLWEIQTPQIYEFELLKRGYQDPDILDCTDDAQVIEKLGESVYLIEGDSRNIKVTTKTDYYLVKSILGIRGERERPAHKRF
jgi:2-C-methyl-D-erythritol 4-phosphate cytidylyltransferase